MIGEAHQSPRPEPGTVKNIIQAYKKLSEFNDIYDGSKEDLGDSIEKYNYLLISLISAPEFALLKFSDYNSISKLTEIAIRFSQDKKIMVASWITQTNLPQQTCFNILWTGGEVTKIGSMQTGNKENYEQYENDVRVEEIIDFNLRGKKYYLLMGSNRIGNLDILKMISAFYLGNNGKLNPARIFYDGIKYDQELEFDYILDADIKIEPLFLIKGDKLTCPTFNEYRTKVTGFKTYRIKSAPSFFSMINTSTTKN